MWLEAIGAPIRATADVLQKFMFLLSLNYSKSCLLAAFMQCFVVEDSCIYCALQLWHGKLKK
jgi:hypothetical protein